MKCSSYLFVSVVLWTGLLWPNQYEQLYAQRVAALGGKFAEVLVIGGGCAGLTAGFIVGYLRRSVTVFMGDKPGGQLIGSQWVENIPGMAPASGADVMEQFQQRAEAAGAQLVYSAVIDLHKEIVGGKPLFVATVSDGNKNGTWCGMAVVCAMGGIPRTLGVPGEELYLNKQIFTCALCDGGITTGADVYVVGGGDASVDAIMTLFGFGARSCQLLVRKGAMRANPALQQRLKPLTNCTYRYQSRIVEIKGDGTRMRAIVVEGPEGRSELPAEYLFYSIGHNPVTHLDWVRRLMLCDAQGYIQVDRQQETSCPGIFAAGDVASPLFHQAPYAIGCADFAAHGAVTFVEAYLTPTLREVLKG